jgi:hypothetical protein
MPLHHLLQVPRNNGVGLFLFLTEDIMVPRSGPDPGPPELKRSPPFVGA